MTNNDLKIISSKTPKIEIPEERERLITLLKQKIDHLTTQRDYWRELAIRKQQELEAVKCGEPT